MSEFDDRLKDAIDRGRKRGEATAAQQRAAKLSQEEIKRLHSKHRLQVSDHIENCIQRLPDYFPGFRTETIYGEKGWGAACYRDDVDASPRGRNNLYSRLEVVVRPINQYNVLDIAAKGTIKNREIFQRTYHEEIDQADPKVFNELIDTWILEFAELYSGNA